MRKVHDAEGNELKLAIFQVTDRDEQGPTRLRVLRDHEVVDLSKEENPTFMHAWVHVNGVLGEMRMSDLLHDFEELKVTAKDLAAQRVEQDRAIKGLQREVDAVQEENRVKTEELRRLQRERDPERVEKLVQERIMAATEDLRKELVTRNLEIGERNREIRELKESKRRLKEANERLKNAK